MTELIKALPCGALLAWITALFIGHGGGMGGTGGGSNYDDLDDDIPF